MSIQGRMAIIGGGNIGTSILKGILKSKVATTEQVVMAEIFKERAAEISEEYSIETVTDCREAGPVDVVLMAVEPRETLGVVRELNGVITPQSLVISVAAGITLQQLASALPQNQPAIRAMPNSPVLIAQGVTAISPGPNATKSHVNAAKQIFGAVGQVVEIEEHHLNAVTALSGSGPSYVYVFIEALIDAGVRVGLDRKTAYTLAAQTVMGSALLALETGKHPAVLKEMVTSPGGTSIAALHAMESAGFRAAIMDGVKAAHDRARELAV